MLRNNKKVVQMTAKVKLYRYLKISIPQKMLVNQILIFQVVLILPKHCCSANHNLPQPLMQRKVTSPYWYHMKYVFLIFASPLFLPFGGFAKYVVHFLMEMQVIELFLMNQENLENTLQQGFQIT